MPPAAALAEPGESVGSFQPLRVDDVLDKRFFTFDKGLANITRTRIGVEHAIRVLLAIHLLDKKLAGIVGPIHSRHVHVLGDTGQLDPDCFRLIDRGNTDASR